MFAAASMLAYAFGFCYHALIQSDWSAIEQRRSTTRAIPVGVRLTQL